MNMTCLVFNCYFALHKEFHIPIPLSTLENVQSWEQFLSLLFFLYLKLCPSQFCCGQKFIHVSLLGDGLKVDAIPVLSIINLRCVELKKWELGIISESAESRDHMENTLRNIC